MIWDMLLWLNCPEDYGVTFKRDAAGIEFWIEPLDTLAERGIRVR